MSTNIVIEGNVCVDAKEQERTCYCGHTSGQHRVGISDNKGRGCCQYRCMCQEFDHFKEFDLVKETIFTGTGEKERFCRDIIKTLAKVLKVYRPEMIQPTLVLEYTLQEKVIVKP